MSMNVDTTQNYLPFSITDHSRQETNSKHGSTSLSVQ
jgi:hypothetical protein